MELLLFLGLLIVGPGNLIGSLLFVGFWSVGPGNIKGWMSVVDP